MPEIPRNNTGLSGEYFVAAELYRRGWSVGMTVGNAKAIDLFAESQGKIIPIQVKSIFKKKNVGWPIMKDQVRPTCFYIFVVLNGDKMEPPDYFIGHSEDIQPLIKQYATRGILNRSSVNNPEFKDRWDKLTEI
jgi:hypothetical protein